MAVRILILEELLIFLKLFDSPGTYIMIMVLGLVLVPFYLSAIRHHLKNPQEYHAVSFENIFWAGLLLIIFLVVFGFVNFIRFLPA